MSLKGNTGTMPLPELLRFLDNRKSTGTLELIRGNAWKRLYFEKGRIISSGSSDPSEYLGHFLISENKITEEQLTQALETQKKTKVMLGKILVMIGAVSEEELLLMLETKCKESVFSMFLWEDAEFEFFDNQLPAVRLIPTSMEVEPLVQEGLGRQEEWNRLTEIYPSRQMVFERSQSATGEEYLGDPFTSLLYPLVDGTRSVGDLIMQTHATEYRVLHSLNALKEKGLVQITDYGEAGDSDVVEAFDLTQVIDNGKNKLAMARWEEAMNLFNYVLQYEDNSEAKQLLDRAEKSLVQSIYEEIVTPDSILKLKKTMEDLSKERLTAEESFLVTRVNGRWDLKSILTITPLREVDALRIVKRLIERGIVEAG
jgi:hypothetical protein